MVMYTQNIFFFCCFWKFLLLLFIFPTQDAHIREGELPKIELDSGKTFQHHACWENICHAILEAHHLIYIAGWSVYDKVKLVREPTRPISDEIINMSLGELLKYKSQEGVRVCLLVWDDKTSHDKLFIKTVWRWQFMF
jgi:phospholipase D1/2